MAIMRQQEVVSDRPLTLVSWLLEGKETHESSDSVFAALSKWFGKQDADRRSNGPFATWFERGKPSHQSKLRTNIFSNWLVHDRTSKKSSGHDHQSHSTKTSSDVFGKSSSDASSRRLSKSEHALTSSKTKKQTKRHPSWYSYPLEIVQTAKTRYKKSKSNGECPARPRKLNFTNAEAQTARHACSGEDAKCHRNCCYLSTVLGFVLCGLRRIVFR